MEAAIHVCLEDFQDATTPLNVKRHPLVVFMSYVLDIQLAPLYPSSTVGYQV